MGQIEELLEVSLGDALTKKISLFIGLFIFVNPHSTLGTAVAQWLRCCATNQKVAGSILAGVSDFSLT